MKSNISVSKTWERRQQFIDKNAIFMILTWFKWDGDILNRKWTSKNVFLTVTCGRYRGISTSAAIHPFVEFYEHRHNICKRYKLTYKSILVTIKHKDTSILKINLFVCHSNFFTVSVNPFHVRNYLFQKWKSVSHNLYVHRKPLKSENYWENG